MKVLHIVAGDLSGGAARGAYWLHQSLLENGIQSTVLLSGKSLDDDQTVVSLSSNFFSYFRSKLRGQFDKIILKVYRNRLGGIFSTGFFGYDFTKLKEYKDADVVHLHWVNSGLVSIKKLKSIDKPIIWTLRDMWPFTGGCHYSIGCDRYLKSCGNCPQLGSGNTRDLSRIVFDNKKKNLPENMVIVGISHWLTEQAKLSDIFRNHRCLTISNGISIKEFNYIDKYVSRKALELITNKKIILCGATNFKNLYKGFNKYLECLEYLDKNKVLLVFFGEFDPDLIRSYGFEYRSFGFLNDSVSLNRLYAAADVFVAPSIQEAFGKTIVEAQCSGTPVVCFDATGTKDLVEHKVTGYKVKPFSASDLAFGIEWVISSNNFDELCRNSRKKVLCQFDSKIIAKEYIQLYEEVMCTKKSVKSDEDDTNDRVRSNV